MKLRETFFSGHDKMGRPKIIGLICPQCKRDFSKEHSGSSAYARHVARKNPCGSAEPYSRVPPKFFEGVKRNDYDDISLMHVRGPITDSGGHSWIRNMLQQTFSIEDNKCIVLKNIEQFPNEIYVKRQGVTKVMNIHNLTILTLLIMHERLFPFLELSCWEKYNEFEEWVANVSGVALKDRNWNGTIEPLSYYYIAVRDFLSNYLLKMKHRRHETWMLASATWSP